MKNEDKANSETLTIDISPFCLTIVVAPLNKKEVMSSNPAYTMAMNNRCNYAELYLEQIF